MELSGNTVLITGGATGIGFALAQRFVTAGSEVIICGRKEDALVLAKQKVPSLHTKVCNLETEHERAAFAEWITKEYPKLNVLVNNAGVQRRVDLTKLESWTETHAELAVNLEAPMHLCTLLISHLKRQERSVIINVSSGLAFVPLTSVPIYCATKAGMHSFTLSLRYQLRSVPIEVIEIQPPMVNTDLGGPGLHTAGMDVNEFADVVMRGLANGEQEVSFGFAKETSAATRDQLDAIFERMNRR